MRRIILSLLFFATILNGYAQESIARKWNEALLNGIRRDFARPTVHARNLFHVSAAMYDAWTVFQDTSEPYLLGNTIHDFTSTFDGFSSSSEPLEDLRDKAISYAAYRMLMHRFANSPNLEETIDIFNELFISELGYDPTFTSTDYSNGSAAALGNYIAEQYIQYGLQDGANEENQYENTHYEPVNEYLAPTMPGNPNCTDPNRWQPLAFDVFVDQSGNEIPGATPAFLSPEWGDVLPFSLTDEDKTVYEKDDGEYIVYHDPGPPPYLDIETGGGMSDEYKWGFSLVAIWSGHLDPTLDQLVDISPASLGNIDISSIPKDFENFETFYDYIGGGDPGVGYEINPVTNEAYPAQMVELGDYGRILAEFWADGPDSETPPGHWFTILNYVSDHPQVEKRFNGQGEVLSDLEWDIKAYFLLGGAMHDVAISAWGIKGYYDYIRPISAIRYMADQGQSSDESLPNYSVAGIPLVDGHIELVTEGDPLVGDANENLNKIKLWAWKGPDYIEDPEVDEAGVGWILAENWWPYQRPTFITPPFAGYVSGHSTYSRAAAELMTLLTGDTFFPGGVGEFEAPQNEFLVFEEGPSIDITLQWASYRDASDQCSLSRIWGGIHPPADDIPGRFIGEVIGKEAFEFAVKFFDPETVTDSKEKKWIGLVYPNPANTLINLKLPNNGETYQLKLYDLTGALLKSIQSNIANPSLDISDIDSGKYILKVEGSKWVSSHIIVKE